MTRCMAILLLSLATLPAAARETVTFPAEDGLEVTATLYQGYRDDLVVVAFHQAGSSSGEYLGIAPRLADRGITTLAVDLRSGKEFLTVTNETAERAAEQGLKQNYTDAIPDMLAALRYAKQELNAEQIIAMGSSYSAGLSLILAGRHADLIDGVMAFSPGEYFGYQPSVGAEAERVEQPVLITSAAGETQRWEEIFQALPRDDRKVAFRPQQGRGAHGASALMPRRSDIAQDYWNWIDYYLERFFPYFGPVPEKAQRPNP